MNFGLERLKELPPSLRLIREIHGHLLRNARGGEKTPGDFRRTQNWIGPAGCNLHPALDNQERFLHGTEKFPVLVRCSLVHAQFETIRPFIDGN